ncbi:MAG TPA: glucose-6-phosphate isomerase [Gammaproteobacteria bacterium]|nr:glucose-6-phosphate isomerase [Gammaproteobacteria bacterium]
MTERDASDFGQLWQQLTQHQRELAPVHLRSLFEQDPGRAQRYRLELDGLLLDYSKHRTDEQTWRLLQALARERDLPGWIERLFSGAPVNNTEHRPALHTALRADPQAQVTVGGEDVMPRIQAVRRRMALLVAAVRGGQWQGFGGEPIRHVVNIGIGGSDLGPAMVSQALAGHDRSGPTVHFVSNVDAHQLTAVLAGLPPTGTLFIVNSKSFTTLETHANAVAAREWLAAAGIPHVEAMRRHFLAVSANTQAAGEFGIPADNVLPMWDWIGGRYSLWSAIGLSIAMALGMDGFEALLAGARRMDAHFRHAPLTENMPVILGLLGVWYGDFFGAQTHAVLPYDQRLARLPAFLQQLDMESNGKRVARDGTPVPYQTGPIVWGEVGTNGQHAFFQLLHQGTHLVPADFIGCVRPDHGRRDQHRLLLGNLLAQTEALMRGQSAAEARARLAASGLAGEALEAQVGHRVFPGNQPSTTILLEALTPQTLGMLIALYEHKVFVQGVIWDINPFDQWGVELGKVMAKQLIGELAGEPPAAHDASTAQLLAWCRDGLAD